MCHGLTPLLASYLLVFYTPWGPDQASSREILYGHKFFAAGVNPEKLVCMCLEGDISVVPVSLHFYIRTQNLLSVLLLSQNGKRFIQHLDFSLLFHFFVYLFSRAVSNFGLCLFHSFPLYYKVFQKDGPKTPCVVISNWFHLLGTPSSSVLPVFLL